MQPTPTRPYLLRALYEWMADNQLTPYLVVNAELPNVRVPPQHIKDGQITLNIAMGAVRGLQMDNQAVRFEARFGGVSQSLYVPMAAVIGLYARENGQGLFFDAAKYAGVEPAGAEPAGEPAAAPTPEPASTDKKPSLRILD